ncbi:hypothetical protein B0J12DRAFT_638122, partial [Macrophomina phaseolina]
FFFFFFFVALASIRLKYSLARWGCSADSLLGITTTPASTGGGGIHSNKQEGYQAKGLKGYLYAAEEHGGH